MFREYKNCEEVNKLVEAVSSAFNFVTFHEENHKSYEKDIGTTHYTASTDDNWKMVVSFHNRFRSKHDQKHYYPDVKFERITDDYKKAKELHKKYKTQNITSKLSWVEKTKSDFAELQKTGFKNDDFEKILKLLED